MEMYWKLWTGFEKKLIFGGLVRIACESLLYLSGYLTTAYKSVKLGELLRLPGEFVVPSMFQDRPLLGAASYLARSAQSNWRGKLVDY